MEIISEDKLDELIKKNESEIFYFLDLEFTSSIENVIISVEIGISSINSAKELGYYHKLIYPVGKWTYQFPSKQIVNNLDYNNLN